MMYADIVLPLAQPAYTFAVPEGMELRCGDAVAVQFGQRYIYTGIVWRLHGVRPDFKRVKSVGARLYDVPLLDERQMRFWEWMADYYMCTLGEVMRMALPSMAKPRGRSEEEFSAEVFRPRTEQYVALAEAWRDAGALSAECDPHTPPCAAPLRGTGGAGSLRRRGPYGGRGHSAPPARHRRGGACRPAQGRVCRCDGARTPCRAGRVSPFRAGRA